MSFGVGVIGAGTVGGGVIQTLLQNRGIITEKTDLDVVLRHVAELNDDLLEGYDLKDVKVTRDALALINDPEVHVVCELIGGEQPAKKFMLAALNAGKHVVTANKMLLAKYGPELTEAAIANNVELRYEAAVAGTIPIIKALRESLVANHINGVYGILNGTCNYILTRMAEEGLEFDAVLQQAIAQGFAETPPDLDIEGHDTAHKCQILAALCYNTPIKLEDIFVEGVTRVTQMDVAYSREMGYDIKLLAVARKVDNEIEARVHPTLVPSCHLLASVKYEFNAVYVDSDIADQTLYYGRGAGRFPTASAIVGDIVDIARHRDMPAEPPFRYTNQYKIRDIGLARGRYYLRIKTEDHPGVLGTLCAILGKHGVSIATLHQKEETDGNPAHIVLLTHESLESNVLGAIIEIDTLADVTENTQLLRVLN